MAARWQRPGGLPGAFGAPAVKLRAAIVEPSAGPVLRSGDAPVGAQAMQRVKRNAQVGGGLAGSQPTVSLGGAGGQATGEPRGEPFGEPVEGVLVQRVEQGGGQVGHPRSRQSSRRGTRQGVNT